MFERFKKWIYGKFICKKCGVSVHLMCFGFGETICPKCYDGEEKFIFVDKSYWLNRMIGDFIES